MQKTVYLWISLLATFSMMLLACSEGIQKPAPLGEYAVLEQLATAYRTTSEQFSVQPQAMRPESRKEFVNRVFVQAGYSYSATLLAVANAEVSATNQDHHDLVDLLLLPAKGLADADLASVYSAEELVAVQRLRAVFR
jgi:hypothetical protein